MGESFLEQEKLHDVPPLWIAGLAGQHPPYLFGPDKVDEVAKRFHDVENPELKRLLTANRHTGIETRASVLPPDKGFATLSTLPSISDLDTLFRKAGVDLAVQACKKALKEWGGSYNDITHTIAITAQNAGCPGFDLLVNQKLGIRNNVDRMLLNGMACAGGLSILRAAAQIANGASLLRQPARILGYACELCTLSFRLALENAANKRSTDFFSAIYFGDGAAAFVLCNDFALEARGKAVFQLVNWEQECIPNTAHLETVLATPTGFALTVSGDIIAPKRKLVVPMFQRLLSTFRARGNTDVHGAEDFDVAAAGAIAMVNAAQESLGLTDEQLRASFENYRTRGMCSSPTVLMVLDRLRRMGEGKDNVVAVTWGAGLVTEMAALKRCRRDEDDE